MRLFGLSGGVGFRFTASALELGVFRVSVLGFGV